MTRIAVAVMSLTVFLSAGPGFAQTGSWGLASGRAGASDAVDLVLGVGRVLNAEAALNRYIEGPTTALTHERQKQILGLTADPDRPDSTVQGLHDRKRQWWVDNILQPALDIAANPAATCALARSMLERIVLQARQAQIIGLGDESFGAFGDSTAIVDRGFRIALRRCLEEAYDECTLTGNAGAFSLVAPFVRQRELLQGDDADWGERYLYLIRRCAVYKLGYRTSIVNRGMRASSEWEGSFVMLFQRGNADDLLVQTTLGYWEAPRPQDDGPPEILLLRVDCMPRFSHCDREPAVTDGRTVARLQFKQTVIEQVPRVVFDPTARDIDNVLGGRAVIETTRRSQGEDRFRLWFEPPKVFLHSRSPDGGLYTRLPPAGTDWYVVATRSAYDEDEGLPLAAEQGTRGGVYPVLFTATSIPRPPAGPWAVSESTRFELTHRPDLFPADEIRPEYEVKETQPRPPRIPARSRF